MFSSVTSASSPRRKRVLTFNSCLQNDLHSRSNSLCDCSCRFFIFIQPVLSKTSSRYLQLSNNTLDTLFIESSPLARLQKDPWWPTHHERDVYISLLQQTDPPAPDHILKAALLRRAVTDITRIHSMREDKQAATVLVQKGSVGDDLLTRLLAAEKELETEILEVVAEANSFKEGWGSYIFQTASEMLANEKTRELYSSLPRLRAEMGRHFFTMLRTMLTVTLAGSPQIRQKETDADK